MTDLDIVEVFKICRLICLRHVENFERCKLSYIVTTVSCEYELIIHTKDNVYNIAEKTQNKLIDKITKRFT